jgi:tRNA-2-methylthio-N6-dimethylallyladenosine synthase
MNVADSQRVASALEGLGYHHAATPEEADVVVLNTCVVRQSAEDRAYGRLTTLRPLKLERPGMVINLMGCLVGVKGNQALRDALPYVDVFSPPSDPRPLLRFLARESDGAALAYAEAEAHAALQDDLSLGALPLRVPEAERGRMVSAHVPVVYGCSHACTFCIIPMRRGVERSRPVGEVVGEVRALAQQGVREVTLLGQIVDRYGREVPDGPRLADLLRQVHTVENIERIRFLTSHPNWMDDEVLRTVAELPKLCEHIEVPVQAGDDEVLARMKRGYTADDYRRLVERIRRLVPGASIATDIIVGFPGETRTQFESTYRLLEELRLDVAHLARYSPRPGTLAARRFEDDVPEAEKMDRFRVLEDLQASIADQLNQRSVGQTLQVLVEGMHKGRWKGRTRNNRLVFFDDAGAWHGALADVHIRQATAWSLQGSLAASLEPFEAQAIKQRA